MTDKLTAELVSLDNPEVKQKHRLAAGLKVDGQNLLKDPPYSKPNP